MANFFALDPEAAGELGEGTEMSRDSWPPTVQRLQWILDVWPEDDLLYRFPSYVVTAAAAERLVNAGLTGFTLRDVEVVKTPEFDKAHSDRTLPLFRWLSVEGVAGSDDFGLDEDGTLVVSERALASLREGRIGNCDVENFTSATRS